MTNQQFKPGDTVYNEHGEEAEFVAKSMGEFIVRPILEDVEGFTYRTDIMTWKQAFRAPPKPKLDAETAAAEEKLSNLRAEIAAIQSERRKFDAEEADRMARIKAHRELADLDKYLAGEITHYVAKHEYGDHVAIIPVGETIEEYSSTKGFGMLHLYPSRRWDKKIFWTLRYRTNSDWRSEKEITAIPCCGEEQAKAVAIEVLELKCAQQLAADVSRRHYTKELIACCRKFGAQVPQQLIDDTNAAARASLERQAAHHIESAEKFKAELAALQEVA